MPRLPRPEISAVHRLPIEHPEYRYPRSRNPYWEKLGTLQGKVYPDNESESLRGSWRKAFPAGSRQELHVELGCNAGHVTLEWAAQNPRKAYVGIDWKFKPIFRAADKARRRGIENLIFCRAHAERIQYIFGPGEVDRLCLYFPDPWAKKSQWKNRYLTAERLRQAAGIVREGGYFHIKTDHDGYFDWMEEAVAQAGPLWKVASRSRDLHAGHPDPTSLREPEVTLFERIFIKEGIPIKDLLLRRTAAPVLRPSQPESARDPR